MKNLLIVFLIFSSVNIFAIGRTNWATITQIDLVRTDGFMVYGLW